MSDLKRQREESSSDDESDVEFILAPLPGKGPAVPAPTQHPDQAAQQNVSAQPGLRQPAPAPQPAAAAATATAQKEKPQVPGVDVDAVATINGKPITQTDLNSFEDKPWRKPGADLTDYFNYGFDEFTWTAYCSKQDHTRANFTPQRVMAQMGMPPMFLPGMMGMNMPGMPAMPGMPGMPGGNMQQKR